MDKCTKYHSLYHESPNCLLVHTIVALCWSKAYQQVTMAQNRLYMVGSITACVIILLLIFLLLHAVRKRKMMEKIVGQQQRIDSMERQRQNLIQVALEGRMANEPSEILATFHQTVDDNRNLKPSDWIKLYVAVNRLYPNFELELRNLWPNIKRVDRQIAYLMMAGMEETDIVGIMKRVSRSTIYRKVGSIHQKLKPLFGVS